MPISRRGFIRRAAATTVVSGLSARTAIAAPRWMRQGSLIDVSEYSSDFVEMKTLAMKAIDSARTAGAQYADVRLTTTVSQLFKFNDAVRADISDVEELSIGVRALVNGYWGFSASPYWTVDEAARIATDAVAQAKSNARGSQRIVELGKIPIATGTWTTPGIDPFTITIEEKLDFMNGLFQSISDRPATDRVLKSNFANAAFTRQDRFFASSEGSATGQTFYTVSGDFQFKIQNNNWRGLVLDEASLGGWSKGLSLTQNGWNVFTEANIREQIPQLVEESIEASTIPMQVGDIGRYDIVFDAGTTASLIANTFVPATQLDRALGYEANAEGTSYLGPDPFAHLGVTQVAQSDVTIGCNRSMPGGLATVKWDDEGVSPAEFNIIESGMLVDYQTTREQAAWLKPWYDKRTQPVQSHGCSTAVTALSNPAQLPPNFVMKPSASDTTFESLVAGTEKGLAILRGNSVTDFQAKNGRGFGQVREIINGRLGPTFATPNTFLFNSLELWKNVTVIGGAKSASSRAFSAVKGQPAQSSLYTISAVPMAVKNVSMIDPTRRA